MNRRGFLTGLIAAPVIVRCTSLMQIRGIVVPSVATDITVTELLGRTRDALYSRAPQSSSSRQLHRASRRGWSSDRRAATILGCDMKATYRPWQDNVPDWGWCLLAPVFIVAGALLGGVVVGVAGAMFAILANGF